MKPPTDKQICKIVTKALAIVAKRGGTKGELLDKKGRCCAEGAVALACGVDEKLLPPHASTRGIYNAHPRAKGAKFAAHVMSELNEKLRLDGGETLIGLNDDHAGKDTTNKALHKAAKTVCPVEGKK